MRSIDFLISYLTKLSELFSESIIRLGYNEDETEYVVEISPRELLNNNVQFKGVVNKVFLIFLELYTNQSLVLITEVNFIKLDNPKLFWHDGIMQEINQPKPTNKMSKIKKLQPTIQDVTPETASVLADEFKKLTKDLIKPKKS